ncbi:hypothetical protein ACMZ4W_02225 [Brevundimonas naejangsanensis]
MQQGEVALQNRDAAHGINRGGVTETITLCVEVSAEAQPRFS